MVYLEGYAESSFAHWSRGMDIAQAAPLFSMLLNIGSQSEGP